MVRIRDEPRPYADGELNWSPMVNRGFLSSMNGQQSEVSAAGPAVLGLACGYTRQLFPAARDI